MTTARVGETGILTPAELQHSVDSGIRTKVLLSPQQ
jgi:hypothetical protein